MKNSFYVIFTALALGIAGYFLSGAVFLTVVFGGICYAIYRNTSFEDRDFVLRVLIAGFAVRVALAVLLHAYYYMKGFYSVSGDELLYSTKAWTMLYKWEGKPYIWALDIISATKEYGVNPFTYILAAFYKIFGFHPVISKMINCGIGTFTGWIAYLTGKELFGNKIARIAMIVTVFFPSMVRWSVANLKDPLVNFLFLLCIYVLVKVLNRSVRVADLVIFAFALTLQYFFTQIFNFFLIVFSAAAAVFLRFFCALRSLRLKTLVIALILTGILACTCYIFCAGPAPVIDILYICEGKQTSLALNDNAGYLLYSGDFMERLSAGRVSLSGILDVLFRGVAYFMLSPFPWAASSINQIMVIPQIFLWYAVLIFAVFGFARLISAKPETALLIGSVLAVGIVIISFVEGNIGAAFRHRDIFTPLFIIFAASTVYDLMRAEKDNV